MHMHTNTAMPHMARNLHVSHHSRVAVARGASARQRHRDGLGRLDRT